MHVSRRVAGFLVTTMTAFVLTIPSSAVAAPTLSPDEDPFYVYDGATPLSDIAPGTVLKTRTGSVVFDVPAATQFSWTQLLYRTRDQLGHPDTTVTTVLKPTVPVPGRVVSYQSFYDSLTTRCEPSYMLNGGPPNGLWGSDVKFLEQLLLQGYTVVTSDFEGQDPSFATGPVYGYQTLDGIRAAISSPDTGIGRAPQVGMVGYSGGAIATEWATELAPTYAPDVDSRLVGAAMGGVFVHPMHNLHYVDGSQQWASVMPLALIGIAKAFAVDLQPYLSDYGKQVVATVEHDCIGEHNYPGLTFAQLVKPEYANPESIPFFVELANELIMGNGSTPSVPLMVVEGTDGASEGTQPSPTYGPGDGVMLVKDVRSLVKKYCDAGVPINYTEVAQGHSNTGAVFLASSIPWLQSRFVPAPPDASGCATVQPGNDLSPTPMPKDDPRDQPGTTTRACRGVEASLVGTRGDDVLRGTPGNDVIWGGAGNDTIVGLGGNDRICAGAGADQVAGGRGADKLFGGSGADIVRGKAGRDVLRGNSGNDRLNGGHGRDRIYGGSGHDVAVTDSRDPRPIGVP